ncbi:MAG: hypothetical protein [Apple virus B]|uniref:Uncharacterized protein n=1 Tax=Apple virus B TaxID=2709746 RepID=A0A6C0X247_9MONO|nr:MAG: hypothetical protein QKO18_gp4 [Apple virus B]QIC52849.1 MAG: hypothetical protein [Apple virus B]
MSYAAAVKKPTSAAAMPRPKQIQYAPKPFMTMTEFESKMKASAFDSEGVSLSKKASGMCHQKGARTCPSGRRAHGETCSCDKRDIMLCQTTERYVWKYEKPLAPRVDAFNPIRQARRQELTKEYGILFA